MCLFEDGPIILVIDDNDITRAYISTVLMDAGYVVFCAENGAAGLDMFSKYNPVLVITDIVMPEQEGIETILELKKINNGLPIIAISGATIKYLNMAKRLGADITLRKPFSPNELLPAISLLLN